MNPYRFVRFNSKRPIRRESECMEGYRRFNGISGLLTCDVTLLMPTFIGQESGESQRGGQVLHQVTRDGKPVLPGSSLKGMVRSVAEVAGGGCICLSSALYGGHRADPHLAHLAQDTAFKRHQSCWRLNELCPTCRLFGMIGKDHFLGKVALSDAQPLEPVRWHPRELELMLQAPKPRHRAFYAPNQQPAGRKFYFHHRRMPVSAQPGNRRLRPLAAGNRFRFTVRYENLRPEEWALLLYALFLEPGMAHKLGQGKPLGLGSVQVQPVRLGQVDVEARYRTLGGGVKVLTDDALHAYVAETTAALRADTGEDMQDLREILAWPPLDVNYRYPSRDWFNCNGSTPLKDTP